MSKLKVDRAGLSNLSLAFIITATVMFFYFVKTERIGGEFLSIFSITQDQEVEDEVFEFNPVLIQLGQYSSLVSPFN